MKDITTIGVDLAKNVIQVHGVDQRGKAVLKKQLPRRRFVEFFANLPTCLIGMEACVSAHHWARQPEKVGHQVRLMAPQYVKPYVKTNKNDAADAEAICEAVSRPSMRFVPIKNAEQQAVLALHRARAGFVKARTAQANQIRGYWANTASSFRRASATSPSDYRRSWRTARTSCREPSASCSFGSQSTSKSLTGRSVSWRRRSRTGIARMRRAGSWRRFRASGR